MDLNRIIQALKGTIDPKLRVAAETELNQVSGGLRPLSLSSPSLDRDPAGQPEHLLAVRSPPGALAQPSGTAQRRQKAFASVLWVSFLSFVRLRGDVVGKFTRAEPAFLRTRPFQVLLL